MISVYAWMKKILWIGVVIVFVAFPAASVQAVIIEGGDGSGNTSVPADSLGDPGWANVGHGNNSSVYLGNRWVLTCAHVGPANTIFNGETYSKVTGSTIRLHESLDGDPNNPIDLLLYRIDANPPGLANLLLSTATPTQGSLVTAIGLGTDRGISTANGFLWGSSNNTKRWGRNLVSPSWGGTINAGYGNNHVFQTTFDRNPSSSLDPSLANNEFQASSGDSGGAVFYKDNNGWKLAGILEAVSGSGSANYGDITYSIDLSYYANQITSVMATCPFSGTIVDPVSTLGAGVSAYLSGNGGFQPLAGICSVAVDTKLYDFTFDTGTNTISQTGVISGNGGLIKNGAGNLILSESNAFFGTTTVNLGTLTLAGGDLGNSPLLSLASGTSLLVVSGTPHLGDIAGNGLISIVGNSTVLTARSIQADSLNIGNLTVVAIIPEPSTITLICTFSLAVSFWRRNRKAVAIGSLSRKQAKTRYENSPGEAEQQA